MISAALSGDVRTLTLQHIQRIEMHGVGQVQMAIWYNGKIKFALYNHISIATLNIPPLKTFTSGRDSEQLIPLSTIVQLT